MITGLLVAGSSGPVYSSDDGGKAVSAKVIIQVTSALSADPSGNVYFANNELIKKVDASGIMTTFAKPAFPLGLSNDRAGNLYFGDIGGGSHTGVWNSDADGKLTRVANTAYPNPITAVDAAGTLYFADGDSCDVASACTSKVQKRRGDGSQSTLVSSDDWIESMAVTGDGTIYVAFSTKRDSNGDHYLTKILPSGDITRILQDGCDNYILGIAADDAGSCYVLHRKNCLITTDAAGKATVYSIDSSLDTSDVVSSLAVSPAGTLYLSTLHQIYRLVFPN